MKARLRQEADHLVPFGIWSALVFWMAVRWCITHHVSPWFYPLIVGLWLELLDYVRAVMAAPVSRIAKASLVVPFVIIGCWPVVVVDAVFEALGGQPDEKLVVIACAVWVHVMVALMGCFLRSRKITYGGLPDRKAM